MTRRHTHVFKHFWDLGALYGQHSKDSTCVSTLATCLFLEDFLCCQKILDVLLDYVSLMRALLKGVSKFYHLNVHIFSRNNCSVVTLITLGWILTLHISFVKDFTVCTLIYHWVSCFVKYHPFSLRQAESQWNLLVGLFMWRHQWVNGTANDPVPMSLNAQVWFFFFSTDFKEIVHISNTCQNRHVTFQAPFCCLVAVSQSHTALAGHWYFLCSFKGVWNQKEFQLPDTWTGNIRF